MFPLRKGGGGSSNRKKMEGSRDVVELTGWGQCGPETMGGGVLPRKNTGMVLG